MNSTLFKVLFFAVFNLVFLASGFAQAKLGENVKDINPHALFELESNHQGLLIPRMTQAERDLAFSVPIPEGLIIYNLDASCVEFWNGKSEEWICLKNIEPIGQQLSLNKNQLLLSDGGMVDLSAYLPKNDQLLSISGNVLSLSSGNSVVLPLSNDNQKISLVSQTLSIERGGSVDLNVLNADDQNLGIIVGVNSVSVTIENSEAISITASGSSQITGIGNGILIQSVDTDTDSQTLAWGLTTSRTTAIEISSGNVLTLATGFGLNLSNASDTLTLTLSETGFETENGVTSNSKGDFANDDFVFGSTQLSNVTGPEDNARIVFDKSHAAFRAGYDSKGYWSESNIGDKSTAIGYLPKAKGARSVAIGANTVAAGFAETALGRYNTERADDPDTWIPTDRLLVVGRGSSSSTRADALTILENGNVGIGEANPVFTLDVDGDINLTGYLWKSGIISATFPDYVFEVYYDQSSNSNHLYQWLDLLEVETFIKKNKHLPGVKSREEIHLQKGWDITEGVRINLEKIEALYLYTIEQEKRINVLEERLLRMERINGQK